MNHHATSKPACRHPDRRAPPCRGRGLPLAAAAHRARAGDKVIIASFVLTDEPVEPRMILVDAQNRFTGYAYLPEE